jgi:hypothetical protein
MLHHNRSFIESLEADRRATATRRRPPVDAGDLERVVINAAARDSDAWASLVARFGPRIRAIARASSEHARH